MANTPHPLCVRLRELRQATRMSLTDVEKRHGYSGILIGSYERGDRIPPLPKIDALFGVYGHRLTTEPIDSSAVRTVAEMVADLRSAADQLERVYDVPAMPDAGSPRLPVPRELHLPASGVTAPRLVDTRWRHAAGA